MIIMMPSQLVFLQSHNTLRQDTSPSQVSTVVKPSDCLVHRSWNIFGFNLIEQEDNNDDSVANDAAEGDDDYLAHRSRNGFDTKLQKDGCLALAAESEKAKKQKSKKAKN